MNPLTDVHSMIECHSRLCKEYHGYLDHLRSLSRQRDRIDDRMRRLQVTIVRIEHKLNEMEKTMEADTIDE